MPHEVNCGRDFDCYYPITLKSQNLEFQID